MKTKKQTTTVYVCSKCGREFDYESTCAEHENGCHPVRSYSCYRYEFFGGAGSVFSYMEPKTVNIDYPVVKEKLIVNQASTEKWLFLMYFQNGKHSAEEERNIFAKAIIDWENKKHEEALKAIEKELKSNH